MNLKELNSETSAAINEFRHNAEMEAVVWDSNRRCQYSIRKVEIYKNPDGDVCFQIIVGW